MDAAQLEPNAVTFNTLIACAARCKQPTAAKQLYLQMNERGCPPTDRTFGALLSAAAGAETAPPHTAGGTR
jgi:pentatricopeptide repeat protein